MYPVPTLPPAQERSSGVLGGKNSVQTCLPSNESPLPRHSLSLPTFTEARDLSVTLQTSSLCSAAPPGSEETAPGTKVPVLGPARTASGVAQAGQLGPSPFHPGPASFRSQTPGPRQPRPRPGISAVPVAVIAFPTPGIRSVPAGLAPPSRAPGLTCSSRASRRRLPPGKLRTAVRSVSFLASSATLRRSRALCGRGGAGRGRKRRRRDYETRRQRARARLPGPSRLCGARARTHICSAV